MWDSQLRKSHGNSEFTDLPYSQHAFILSLYADGLSSHVTWCTGFGFLDLLLDFFYYSDNSSVIDICGILNLESHMATVNSLNYLTVSMPLFCSYMQMDCEVM